MAPKPGAIVKQAFDKSLVMQAPLAAKQVERLKKRHPDESPKQITARLNKIYLSSVTSSGVAAGGAAVLPGAGIPAALTDVVVFTEATVLYVLARTHAYELPLDEIERKEALVLSIMVGDSIAAGIPKAAQRTGNHWAKQIVTRIPMKSIDAINKVLGPRFITKYGAKQGVIVLGKQVPLGLGALIGGGANHLTGRAMVKQADRVFGKPPAAFTEPTEHS